MFKIFENWDGSFTIIPYEFSDDIWSMVFMGIFVLLMGILGVSMAEYMALPVLAIFAGAVVLMYVKSSYSIVVAYPFFAYAWAEICFIITYVSFNKGLGLIGLMGWLLMAIAGVFVLILPFEAIGAFVFFPLTMLWIASMLMFLSESAATSEKWTLYAFRILGIIMLVGIVLSLVERCKAVSRSNGEQKNLINNCVSLLIGIGVVAVFSVFSYLFPGGVVMSFLLLAAMAGLAFVFKIGNDSFSITHYVFLPVLVCWIFKPIAYHEGIHTIMYLEAADKLLSIGDSSMMQFLATRFAAPTLSGFSIVFSRILGFIINLFLRLFDSSLPPFVMPESFALPFGFVALCFATSLGINLRQKIGGSK